MMIHSDPNSRYSSAGAHRLDEARIPRLPAPEENGNAQSWTKARGSAESAIGRYPLISFGVALCAGIALGWWMKRR